VLEISDPFTEKRVRRFAGGIRHVTAITKIRDVLEQKIHIYVVQLFNAYAQVSTCLP
jgi:hypothetical protein